eukprot:3755329-Rhodomonas_salina.1
MSTVRVWGPGESEATAREREKIALWMLVGGKSGPGKAGECCLSRQCLVWKCIDSDWAETGTRRESKNCARFSQTETETETDSARQTETEPDRAREREREPDRDRQRGEVTVRWAFKQRA